jgi:hypothetical protein
MEGRLSDRVKQILYLGKLQCKSPSKQILAPIPKGSGDIESAALERANGSREGADNLAPLLKTDIPTSRN